MTLRRHSALFLAAAGLTLPASAAFAQAAGAAAAATPAAAQQAAGTTDAAAAYARSIVIADPRAPLASRPGALSLAQVLDAARAKNPTLLAAARNLEAVRAQEIQAGVRANPYLTLNGTDITESEHQNNPYNYAVQISRLYERGDKRKWRLADARATTAQTQAQLDDTIRQTELTLKTAFTQMLVAKASLQLTSLGLKQFQHEVDIANDRFQAGDLSRIDFERLDLQVAAFESAESTDLVNLRQASDQLQTLMGIETPSTDFDILGDIVPPNLTQTQTELVQLGLDKRPDLAAARFGVDAAEAAKKLAYANGTTRSRVRPLRHRELRRLLRQHPPAPLRPQPGQQEDRRLPGRRQPLHPRRSPQPGHLRHRPGLHQLHPVAPPLRPLQHTLPRRNQRRPVHSAIRLRARRHRADRLPRRRPRHRNRQQRSPQRLPADVARHPPALRRIGYGTRPVATSLLAPIQACLHKDQPSSCR
jgi:hypothetical protein